MKVTLYSTIDERSKLNKALENEFITEMIFKSATSMFKPVLYVSNNLLATRIEKYNYLYIGEWERYYFIDDIVFDRNNYTMITCTEDVLMSFKDNIMNFDAHIYRCSDRNFGSTNMKDEFLIRKNEFVESVAYETDFFNFLPHGQQLSITSRCFIVSVIGDVSDSASIRDPFVPNPETYLVSPNSMLVGSGEYYNRWILNVQEMSTLANKMLKNSEYASHVLSINLYPFDIEQFVINIGDTIVTENFYLGGETILLNAKRLSANQTGIISGTLSENKKINIKPPIIVNKKFNNCMDYKPYTNFILRIPFYGNLELDNEDVYKGIYYDCALDFLTGKIILSFYRKIIVDKKIEGFTLIKNLSFNVSTQIPINTTNLQEIQRTENSTAISMGFSAFLGLLQGLIGVLLEPVSGGLSTGLVISGIATGVGGLGSGLSKIATLPNVSGGELANGSQNLSMYEPDKIVLIKRLYKVESSPLRISSLYGYPCDMYIKINNLGLNKGTIVFIDNFHDNALSQTPYMMNNEVDSIKEQLLKGIII